MDKALLEKTYHYMKWLLQRTVKFTKDFKYSLAGHVNDLVFELFDGTLHALAMKDRRKLLASLSVTLDTLRYYVRLCSDLKLVSLDQYKFAAESMSKIGKLLGGWIRKEEINRRPKAPVK
jgi:hypothetical protein